MPQKGKTKKNENNLDKENIKKAREENPLQR